MILIDEKTDVLSNTTNSKEFSIKGSAKAFQILSGGLYSDKIKAIIRELSCNAWDAHVMAGNKKPFHVHLPNQLEPWFSVRDYGIGLSEHDVMNLYSTYFESTKTNTNDQIGALGLGSKSPFSYEKSFNVVSIFDGERKTYTAHLNEHGCPTITKTYEQSVEDYLERLEENLPEGNTLDKREGHNGLEVRFAVRANDFDDFAKKAGQVFRIFKVKPEVGGNPRYKKYEQTLTTIIKGRDWKFIKTDFYKSDRAVALQGNIEYPIDKNQLGDLTKEQEFIAEGRFYINFKIGDLDISASRESLGYNEETIMNIKNALTKTYKSFHRMLNKKIQSADTLFNAYILASETTDKVGLSYYTSKDMVFKWRDRKFTLGEDFEYVFSEESMPVDSAGYGVGDGSGIIDDKLTIEVFRRERQHSSGRVTRHGTYQAHSLHKRVFDFTPTELKDSIFIVRDEDEETMATNKVLRKVRQIAKGNIGKNVYFLNEMREAFFDAMGNPEYMVTSDIELAKIQRNSDGSISYPDNYFHMEMQSYGDWYPRNCSYGDLEDKVNDLSGHYYITRVRDKYFDNVGEEIYLSYVKKLFAFLKKQGMIEETAQVFAVKNAEKNTKRWKEMDWKEFTFTGRHMFAEYIENNIDTFKEPLITQKAFSKIENRIGYRMRDRFNKEFNKLSDYPEGSNFANIIQIYMDAKSKKNDVSEELNKINAIVQIGNDMGINIENYFDVNMDKFDLKSMYPMMEFVSDWDLYEDDNFAKLKAYIIMVDESKNL